MVVVCSLFVHLRWEIEKGLRRESSWDGKKRKNNPETKPERVECVRVVECEYTTYGLQMHPVRRYSVMCMISIFSPVCWAALLRSVYGVLSSSGGLLVCSFRIYIRNKTIGILVIPLSPLTDYSCICIQERINLLGSSFFVDGVKNKKRLREKNRSVRLD